MINLQLEGKNEESKIATVKIMDTNGTMVYQNDYDDRLKLFADFKNLYLSRGKIYSKINSKGIISFKSDDGSKATLTNFTDKAFINLVDNKIMVDFKKILNSMFNEKFKYIYLTASEGRLNVDMLSDAQDLNSIICELELDENNELTETSSNLLNYISNYIFSNWNDLFFTISKQNHFQIICDDKIIKINNKLIKYIKQRAMQEEDKFLERNEYNAKYNNGQNGKLV